MPKVDYKDLEEITKFLDKLVKVFEFSGLSIKSTVIINKAKELSKMIKDNYTEIKPDYESTN
jgi:hypothetical protein